MNALRESSLLKPGGVLLAVAISQFASTYQGLIDGYFFKDEAFMRARIGQFLIHSKGGIAGELCLGALLVVGLGFLPPASRSILPILLLAGFSLWCRQLRIAEIGLRRPSSWPKVVLTGLALGLAIALLGNRVILPLVQRWSGLKTVSPGGLPALGNSVGLLALVIVLNWILAAGAEEFVFRGYFLNRILDLAGDTKISRAASVVGSALLFSAGHGFSKWLSSGSSEPLRR